MRPIRFPSGLVSKQALTLLALPAAAFLAGLNAFWPVLAAQDEKTTLAGEERRLLYVAVPGVRDDLQYGGHGLLVFDIDRGHGFVKRIPAAGLDENKKPLNVKGVCASAATGRGLKNSIATREAHRHGDHDASPLSDC